jgi:hypothetical protein
VDRVAEEVAAAEGAAFKSYAVALR